MRTAPLLHMFAEMVRGGVDLAQIWAARTDGPGGLSTRSESGSELTPTGYFFKMLSESVHGMRLVDPGANGHKLFNHLNQQVGYTYTFEDDSRSVVYFVSAVDTEFQLSADLTRQIRDGAYVYTRTLDVAPGDEIDGYWSDAAIAYDSGVSLSTTGGRQIFETGVGAYQLVELHIVHGAGVVKEGDTENNISDELVGSDYDDKLAGSGGWDKLDGLGGNDLLDGGSGKDILRGKQGDDLLFGAAGHDHLMGGAGNDELHGGKGNDRLLGHNDNDVLFGDDGKDKLFGENGDDVLHGGNGRDQLFGGAGADILQGEVGRDTLDGGSGDDRLFGGSGRDDLKGGDGNDALSAGSGYDRLDGGAGADVLTGGAGHDTFVFTEGDAGADRITDFGTGADRVDLSSFNLAGFAAVQAALSDTADGVLLDLGGGQSVLFEGLDQAGLLEQHFLL